MSRLQTAFVGLLGGFARLRVYTVNDCPAVPEAQQSGIGSGVEVADEATVMARTSRRRDHLDAEAGAVVALGKQDARLWRRR
jgi:hypothetical protein